METHTYSYHRSYAFPSYSQPAALAAFSIFRSRTRENSTGPQPATLMLFIGEPVVAGAINKARPSSVFVDSTYGDRLAVAKFSNSRVWNKVQEGSTLVFGVTQISLLHSVG